MNDEKNKIVGIPNDLEKMAVQKSNPLKSLANTDISLSEFKILDLYLSRIDSHDETKRCVEISKGEFEKVLGVERINITELKQHLKRLFQPVSIVDKSKKNNMIMLSLFEKAECKMEEGLWKIKLECTKAAEEYFFNIETKGYLSYMLKNVVNMKSRYSYLMYLYLENKRKGMYKKSWVVDIKELQSLLNCNVESYSQYKEFNGKVLKVCCKEINEKTDLKYKYEGDKDSKENRAYTKVKFTLLDSYFLNDTNEILNTSDEENVKDKEDISSSKVFDAEIIEETIDENKEINNIKKEIESIVKNELKENQIDNIFNLVQFKNKDNLKDDWHFIKDIIEEKWILTENKLRSQSPNKSHKFNYFTKCIENCDFIKEIDEKKSNEIMQNPKSYTIEKIRKKLNNF